ncbi:MAG TPA: hypothetical protein VIK89_15105 [Cytophagaceae bacterium]
MKLIKSFLVLALVLPLIAVANPPIGKSKAGPCSKKVLLQLRNSVEYPEFAQAEELQGVVLVQFNILENSEVEITEIQSSDERLKNYVYSKLNGMIISGSPCDIKEMTMKFSFVLE